jgi:hypothetical protein
MSPEEKVFVLRTGIDLGILNDVLLTETVAVHSHLQQKAAASLLYACAMAGASLDEKVIHTLIENCQITSADLRSLVPVWSAKVLGADLLHLKPLIDSITEQGVSSSDPRDRTMAEAITGRRSGVSLPIGQSQKHLKLRERIAKIYGPLVSEHEIAPGLVVDEANLNMKIAVELNGPTHYLVNLWTGERFLNGPTLSKERGIRTSGWEVIQIDLSAERKMTRF